MGFVFIKVKLIHLILKRVQLLYDFKKKEDNIIINNNDSVLCEIIF